MTAWRIDDNAASAFETAACLVPGTASTPMARWCTTARQLLELFYDLTYVVLISRATHHLVSHVEWRGVGEFAVVFALVWLA